jgi:hypothetical protein
MRVVQLPLNQDDEVTLLPGIDFRDPSLRDPMVKSFRRHALLVRWRALTRARDERSSKDE